MLPYLLELIKHGGTSTVATITDAVFAREWTLAPTLTESTRSVAFHEMAVAKSAKIPGIDHVPTAAPHGTPEFFFWWWG